MQSWIGISLQPKVIAVVVVVVVVVIVVSVDLVAAVSGRSC